MYEFVRKFFFGNTKIKIFSIVRIPAQNIVEQVFFLNNGKSTEITQSHSMICLEPFCIAVWFPVDEGKVQDLQQAKIRFVKGRKINATLDVSLIEKIEHDGCIMFLYSIDAVRNYQRSFLHRFVLFAYLLRNKTSTYRYRRVISALYSYPRKVIVVSYRDDQYYNIFPMDIQGYAKEAGLYVLGLRTTNKALERILATKKVVVSDSDNVDVHIIYELGKHASAAPPGIDALPFKTSKSELFQFPVPEFAGGYKEIEILYNRKMGYHMLMVGRVINSKVIRQNAASLYHLGFLESLESNYYSIDGQY